MRKITRRNFLKRSTYLVALLGLEASWIPKIALALETKKRLPVIWLNFQACTGCTESFLQSSHPLIKDIVLDLISLEFHETIQAAAGLQAEEVLKNSIKENSGRFILVVEGAVPTKDNGVYCMMGGKTALEILKETAAHSLAIITVGHCSSFGGVQAAAPNPTGAKPIPALISGKPIIRIPGCPPIGEVMTGVVAHYLIFGRLPQLDALGRPLAFYKKRIHDTCYRRKYFDAGIFATSFEDPSGCLYKLGCKGPETFNACTLMGWNGGTSSPIRSGHPCIGCADPQFWQRGSFYKRLPAFPGFGVHTSVDKIGLTLTGITAAAFAGHGAIKVIQKLRKK